MLQSHQHKDDYILKYLVEPKVHVSLLILKEIKTFKRN